MLTTFKIVIRNSFATFHLRPSQRLHSSAKSVENQQINMRIKRSDRFFVYLDKQMRRYYAYRTLPYCRNVVSNCVRWISIFCHLSVRCNTNRNFTLLQVQLIRKTVGINSNSRTNKTEQQQARRGKWTNNRRLTWFAEKNSISFSSVG